MSFTPIYIAGTLVAGTIALVRFARLDPVVAGLSAAGIALALIALTTILMMARLRSRHRKMIARRIWAVARRDLADLLNVLTFRR